MHLTTPQPSQHPVGVPAGQAGRQADRKQSRNSEMRALPLPYIQPCRTKVYANKIHAEYMQMQCRCNAGMQGPLSLQKSASAAGAAPLVRGSSVWRGADEQMTLRVLYVANGGLEPLHVFGF